MSGFEINLYSNKQEYYRFSTDDFALLELGIGNYNISSIANLFSVNETNFNAIKPMNPDVKEFFSNQDGSTIINKLIGQNSMQNMAIMEFDIDTKQFKETKSFSEIIKLNTNKYKSDKFTPPSDTDIKSFLQKWNQVQKGFITDEKVVNGYKAVSYKIQNSMSGCILFEADLTVLGESRKSKIKLNLLDNADAASDRGISFKDSPLFSAVPKTPYGMSYSYGGTNSAPIGQFVGGNGNPNDMVAGKMSMTFDPSLGEWQSGTQQILVRLIDNIGVADAPELTADQLLSLTREEIYDDGPDSPGYMGNFTTGKAIPLSSENGNPHMFGPDFKDGCESGNKVVVTVINRLNQGYKAGSIVVVSRLVGDNGAWTIISPGTDGGSKTKKIAFGNFEYQRYIIPINRYFAAPGSVNKITPNIVASRVRDQFYITMMSDLSEDNIQKAGNVLSLLVKMNRSSVVGSINPNSETLIKDIYSAYKNAPQVTQNPWIIQDSLSAFDYIASYYDDSVSPLIYEQQDILPRNILRRSSRIYNIGTSTGDNELAPTEVPSFWGMLFPDGYKIDQCKKFKRLTNEVMFLTGGKPLKSGSDVAGDPNLTELSCYASISFPDLKDPTKNILFIESLRGSKFIKDIPYLNNYIRKTGGVFTNPAVFFENTTPSVIKKQISLDYYIDSYDFSKLDVSNVGDYKDPNTIFGLEPIIPNRLQFSPLSIEGLYAGSTLNNSQFQKLKSSIDILNVIYAQGSVNTNILDSLLTNGPFDADIEPATPDNNDAGNIYFSKSLVYSNVFDSQSLNRHSAPKGVLDGPIIPSPVYGAGNPRIPAIPVLTCKSNISTTSSALTFTTTQYFGEVPKQTVGGGQVGQVVVLPIGGGLAWQNPSSPISTSSFPQWGDSNRTDDIDSMGTTSLHIKVYEAWPLNQTIFLGMLFTPLHFNPSTTAYKKKIEFNSNGIATVTNEPDASGKPIEARSPVDFQIPAYKNKSIISVGTVIAKDSIPNIAPISDWPWSNCRRAQLLTGGGFVYLKPVFAVSKCEIDPKNSGTGYTNGTVFTFPDGSTYTITVDGDGKITGGTFKQNYDNENILIEDANGILSLNNVTPTQSESGGAGAKFILTFILALKIGYDRPPLELVPTTRISKKSSGNEYPNSDGEGPADGTLTTSVSLEGSNVTNYDIFYFFHNDPTHYTLDNYKAFHRPIAQYIISEVQAG